MRRYEIVLSGSDWREAICRLCSRPDSLAIGRLDRFPYGLRTDLIVDGLSVVDAQGLGATFAPLAAWIAIALPGLEPYPDIHGWLNRLGPAWGQLLIILLVGLGPDKSDWRGWSIQRGEVQPLSGFRVIGPEMLVVRTPDKDAWEDDDGAFAAEERWSRTVHAVGGPDVFPKLRRLSVGVIGCSRVGSLMAAKLAALGVRRLVLMDGDLVEPHNLDGMLLATESDIGQNKAVVVARRLEALRSDLILQAMPRKFGARSEEPALRGIDFLVTCVDNDAPRLRAAWLARRQLIPHLDLGTGVTRESRGSRLLAADIRLLLPKAGCVRCVGGLRDLNEAEYELRAPVGALPLNSTEPWDARGRLGSLVSLSGITIATGLQSLLDLLGGNLRGSIWHRLRWQAGGTWEVRSQLVTSEPRCPVCQSRM